MYQRGYKKEIEEGYLGLFVDRKARRVWRLLKWSGTGDTKAEFDFSGSEGMWYCFLRIYDSGSDGVPASDLRAGYPLNKNSYRQTVFDMRERIGALGIMVENMRGRGRRRRFVDAPLPPKKFSDD